MFSVIGDSPYYIERIRIIYVTPVEKTVKIKTGETGDSALEE